MVVRRRWSGSPTPDRSEQATGSSASVGELHDYLPSSFPYRIRIIIADHVSEDVTPYGGERPVAETPEVSYLRLEGLELLIREAIGTPRVARGGWRRPSCR